MANLNTPLALAMVIAALPLQAAQANDLFKSGPSVFNYNYVELKFIDASGAEGIGLFGSADYKENIALQVDYAGLSGDADFVTGVVTWHKQAARFPQADWLLSGGLQAGDINGNDDAGLILSAGARYAVSDPLEVSGSLSLSTLFDTDLSLNLKALYEVATGFSALVETNLSDDSSIAVGVRFYWR